MRPTTIAMLGSCVTSTAYYRLRSADLQMANCRTGTSLVSLMSPALSLDRADLEPLEPHARRRVEGDVTRSALDFLESGADFYLLDLGDEICDLLQIGDSFVNRTSVLKKSHFLRRYPDHKVLRRDDPATTRLWMDACTRFCRGPLAAIPQDRIVLHRVQLAPICTPTDVPVSRGRGIRDLALGSITRLRMGSLARGLGRIVRPRRISRTGAVESAFEDVDPSVAARAVDGMNTILEGYFQFLREQLPGAHVIDVPVRYRMRDPAHRFGPSALHYVEDYDRYFMATLRDLIGRILAGGVN